MNASKTVGELRALLSGFNDQDVVAITVEQCALTPEMWFGILDVDRASGDFGYEVSIKVGVLE